MAASVMHNTLPLAMAPTSLPQFAPTPIGPKIKGPTRPAEQLPQYMVDEGRNVQRVKFDPKKHLNFNRPEKTVSMEDIGLGGQGISPTAVSDPFSLFTPEAIAQMRAEIFSQPVLNSCQYSSDFAKNMIRGFGPKLAPFIFAAWHSPEVLEAVSNIAGIELVPAIEFDVGHINISVNDSTTELSQIKDTNYEDDDQSAFAWHRDSFPFVCVTMLSDCTGMVGGETAIKTGSGDVIKVRGPAMGTAVVMQGRYIEHQALKARGGRERVSMVTSFRPKNPMIRDEVVLTGVRAISNLPELYSQYTQYRLEVLEERIRDMEKKVREREREGRKFDVNGTRNFVNEQKQFLEAMLLELIDD